MLNDDNDVHGIIVQMPLDSDHKIDARRVLDAVDPDKDVDGSVFISHDSGCSVCGLNSFSPWVTGLLYPVRRTCFRIFFASFFLSDSRL